LRGKKEHDEAFIGTMKRKRPLNGRGRLLPSEGASLWEGPRLILSPRWGGFASKYSSLIQSQGRKKKKKSLSKKTSISKGR